MLLGHTLTLALLPLTLLAPQSLDAALKTICTALLESDVNVKLVKTLRDRVKVKVLPQLVEIQKKSSGDALAGNKGKQLIQRVSVYGW